MAFLQVTTFTINGSYFGNFIATTIETGRYNNASEGEESGGYEGFDHVSHLKTRTSPPSEGIR